MNQVLWVKYTLWFVGICYGYGAVVHIFNIAGLGGFDWGSAPLKWQVLDVTYLVLNIVVLVGFLRDWQPAYWAFFIAALSQIMLYTLFRDWILDVPTVLQRNPQDQTYLDFLVGFHVATVMLVGIIMQWRHGDEEET